LRDEAVSYKNSAEQMTEVRNKLTVFIEKTERISHDTHELIGVLREIGGPEILDAVGAVSNDVKELSASSLQQYNRIKLLVTLILISSILGLIFGVLLFLK
jgi:hypothetical protein